MEVLLLLYIISIIVIIITTLDLKADGQLWWFPCCCLWCVKLLIALTKSLHLHAGTPGMCLFILQLYLQSARRITHTLRSHTAQTPACQQTHRRLTVCTAETVTESTYLYFMSEIGLWCVRVSIINTQENVMFVDKTDFPRQVACISGMYIYIDAYNVLYALSYNMFVLIWSRISQYCHTLDWGPILTIN